MSGIIRLMGKKVLSPLRRSDQLFQPYAVTYGYPEGVGIVADIPEPWRPSTNEDDFAHDLLPGQDP
jgi:hypothetical protein